MATAAAVPFDEAVANLEQTQEPQTQQSQPGHQLFESVVEDDYESLVKLFATNARNSLVSYMSMKSRWARQRQDSMAKSGKRRNKEKVVDSVGGHLSGSPAALLQTTNTNGDVAQLNHILTQLLPFFNSDCAFLPIRCGFSFNRRETPTLLLYCLITILLSAEAT